MPAPRWPRCAISARTTAACEAAVTRADWPARMQRLRTGPLADIAPRAELWLDGGHNPAAGEALARHLAGLPDRAHAPDLRHAQHQGRARLPAPAGRRSPTASSPCRSRTRRTRCPPRPRLRLRISVGLDARVAGSVAEALRADRGREPGRPHPDLRVALPRRTCAAQQWLAAIEVSYQLAKSVASLSSTSIYVDDFTKC